MSETKLQVDIIIFSVLLHNVVAELVCVARIFSEGRCAVAKQRTITAITPFKVIQGHQSWYRKHICDFLCANNSNLITSYLARFRDMMDYWSNFRCRLFSTIIPTASPECSIANLFFRNWKRPSFVWSKAHFDKMWLTSMIDGRTDRQTLA